MSDIPNRYEGVPIQDHPPNFIGVTRHAKERAAERLFDPGSRIARDLADRPAHPMLTRMLQALFHEGAIVDFCDPAASSSGKAIVSILARPRGPDGRQCVLIAVHEGANRENPEGHHWAIVTVREWGEYVRFKQNIAPPAASIRAAGNPRKP